MLTFTNDELLELLRNRAKFRDRIGARAADRLAQALDLLARAAAAVEPPLNAEIQALLNIKD